ncbi:MAG: T9SS type A sorting domain-containing protein [Melioribacteraceae bacterium]|nr:T9SS type A sorting domain-containing protein [Melioribacteraceae bacterium]
MQKRLLVVLTFLFVSITFAQVTHYVSTTGGNNSPYTNWADAANNIQNAVNAAVAGDLVLVNDGTYVLSSNITISSGITVRSVNGYSLTIIDGNNATRCLYINHVDAVVDGFTIQNGYNPSGFGGGINISSGGTVQNSLISNNQARDGGGLALDNGGYVINSIITGNSADNNSSNGYGGGVRLLNGGTVRGSLIYNNTSQRYGGGINIWNSGTIQNCTITGNDAPNGGGIRARNNSTIENSIIYFNTSSGANYNWETNGSGYSFTYSSSMPALPAGAGNVTADPLFENAGADDYHLSSASTLIDAGLNDVWMTGMFDMDGTQRIYNGTVDIGAYEYMLATPGVPVLGSPSDFAVGVSIEPAFTWSAVSGATSYTLQLATDAAFTSNVSTYSGILGTTYTVTGLSNSTQYYWRMSATNGGGTSSYSSSRTFTTTSAIITNLSWPIGGATVYTNSPTLLWWGAGTTYDLLYSLNSDMSAATVVSGINTTSYTLTGLTSGTTYYWQIRTRNSIGVISAYSIIESFSTIVGNGAPVIPVPSWPIGGAVVYSNTQTLYWYLNTYSAGLVYEVEYSTGALTGTPNITGITSLSTVLSGLAYGTTYNWQVRSTDGVTTSAWSVQESFTTVGASGGPIIPIPSWPIGGATIYTNSPTLYWYLNGSGVGLVYEIEYSTGGLTGTPTVTSITSSYFALSGLLSGTTYNWQVRSTDGVTTSAWSVQESFTTTGSSGGPVIPNPSWPIGGATVYSSSPSLYWYLNEYSAGLSYEVEYSTGVLTGTPNVTGITSLSTNLSGLGYGTTYNWQVRSTDGVTNSSWSVQESFVVSGTIGPVVPIPSWPIGGAAVSSLTPTLYWYLNSNSSGLEYEVLYSTSSVTSGGVLQNATSTSTWASSSSFTMPTLIPGATYFWQVRSRLAADNAQVSNYSNVESFVTNAYSSPIILIPGSPVGNTIVQTSSPTLSWILPTTSESELTYEIEIANNQDMIGSEIFANLENPFYELDELNGDTKYFWRARSKNGEGLYSQYSDIGSFSIGDNVTGVSNEKVIPTKFFVGYNYPNPFNPTTTIQYGIPESAYVTVKIYNMLGEEVSVLVQSEKSAGTYEIMWTGNDNFGNKVSSGTYIFRVVAGDQVMSRKMILMK